VHCAPQQTGRGNALRLVRPAARQLTAVAQPLQGPVASARSCVPLRMRAITTGISQLDSRSLLRPPSADASVGCWPLRRRIRSARCTCSLALAGQLCSEGQECPVHPNLKAGGQIDRAHHASPESATLRSLSERVTLVTAVTSILLRHGRLRRERN
jgi:hypothetical protein